MSNQTAKEAGNVHGQNPQYLIEKILRSKIYDCDYWKEECFGLSALTIIDRAMELDHVGTVYTTIHRPTPFICLVLKLLQIGPSMDIVLEFINNEDYKYVTALGMFYLRLVGTPDLIYKTLEPFYSDFRKLRLNTPEGWKIIHMDEFVDELLEKQMAFTISLPLLPARKVLELRGELPPRESVLDEEFEEMAAELEKEESKESESKRVKTK